MKIVKLILFLFLYLSLFKPAAWAVEFKTIYNASYIAQKNGLADVTLKIQIAHPDTNTYTKEYSLVFPKTFKISNFRAYAPNGEIKSEIQNDNASTKVKLIFSEPTGPDDIINDFTLSFDQANLFNISGNILEVILPTFGNRENVVFNIEVSLPPEVFPEKDELEERLSIAKPKPSAIAGNKIFWQNVKAKTVYAVFGQSQYYHLNLIYNLENEKKTSVYYDIAFPPETQYQNIIVDSISPRPEKAYLDEDGNYLGRYTLKAEESKKVVFNGYAKVLAKPDEEMFDYTKAAYLNGQKYLFTEQKYWGLGDNIDKEEIKNLKSEKQIYNFVRDNLTYNYEKIGSDNKRLGAATALKNPTKAVCMEFTDLFVALAREKGVPAREIDGYGFSKDDIIRPLSLAQDLLHSWPEYYDQKNNLWIPIDPTWENTSGIDYFNSFDLSHIVFSIHGKDSSYPAAAGMYKINDYSKDIMVEAVEKIPHLATNVDLSDDIKPGIVGNKKYTAHIKVKNQGNHFIKKSTLRILGDKIEITPNKIAIDLLAPFESREYKVEYSTNAPSGATPSIEYRFNGEPLMEKNLKVVSFLESLREYLPTAIIGLIFPAVFIMIKYLRRKTG